MHARFVLLVLMTAVGAALLVEAIFETTIAAWIAIGLVVAAACVYIAFPTARRRTDDRR